MEARPGQQTKLSPKADHQTLNLEGPAVLAATDCRAVLQERSGSWLPGVSIPLYYYTAYSTKLQQGIATWGHNPQSPSEEFCMNIRHASQSNLSCMCCLEALVASMMVMNG